MRTPKLSILLVSLGLIASVGYVVACGNSGSDGPAAPGGSARAEGSSPAITAPSSSAPATPTTTTSAESAPSTAPSASATPSASAPSAIADAGAPKDAGAKPPKDAGAPASSAIADAGSPAAKDAGATAALSPGNAIAKQVDAVYVGNKTYSAKFKQEYTLKVSGQTKKSTGTVIIERPDKISFRYDLPNKNRIVSDGSTLKVYIAEDNQMFESPVKNTQYPGAFGFLMGNGISSSFDFTINDKATYTDGPVLVGKPTSPNPSYESVIFSINKAFLEKSDPGTVARVLVLDAQGNKNRFDLEGATHPATIDPGEFQFTPPQGTNVTR